MTLLSLTEMINNHYEISSITAIITNWFIWRSFDHFSSITDAGLEIEDPFPIIPYQLILTIRNDKPSILKVPYGLKNPHVLRRQDRSRRRDSNDSGRPPEGRWPAVHATHNDSQWLSRVLVMHAYGYFWLPMLTMVTYGYLWLLGIAGYCTWLCNFHLWRSIS